MSTTTTDSLVRAVLLIVVLLLAVPLVMMAAMIPFMASGAGAMGIMGAWGWIGPLIALVVLAAGGYLLYGAVSGSGNDAAVEELRRTYARGEIDTDEFEERRERLQRSGEP